MEGCQSEYGKQTSNGIWVCEDERCCAEEPIATPPKQCPEPPRILYHHKHFFNFTSSTNICIRPQPLHSMTYRCMRSWDAAIFDCSLDPLPCCITAVAPCVTFGRVAQFADDGTTLACVCKGGVYCMLWSIGLQRCYSCKYREKLRKKLMLPGSKASDFYVHCLCEPCALCQEYHQINHHSSSSFSHARSENGIDMSVSPPLPMEMSR